MPTHAVIGFPTFSASAAQTRHIRPPNSSFLDRVCCLKAATPTLMLPGYFYHPYTANSLMGRFTYLWLRVRVSRHLPSSSFWPRSRFMEFRLT